MTTLRTANQMPGPVSYSMPQTCLHDHLLKAERHNKTFQSRKRQISILEERSASPATMPDLTNDGRRKRLISKTLLVNRRIDRKRSLYPNRRSAPPVRFRVHIAREVKRRFRAKNLYPDQINTAIIFPSRKMIRKLGRHLKTSVAQRPTTRNLKHRKAKCPRF